MKVPVFVTTLAIDDESGVQVELFIDEDKMLDFLRGKYEAPDAVIDLDLIQWVIDNKHVALYIDEHAVNLEVDLV